jgi:SAM-dependent MidA family methyltransferase
MQRSKQPPFTEQAGGAPSIIAAAILQAGGWLPFDQFMGMALYAPGAGYYSQGAGAIGLMPGAAPTAPSTSGGSDFATAPEMSPAFGQALAQQVAEALRRTGTTEVWEFGAGTGALALDLLQELDRLHAPCNAYCIVDLSGALKARQRQTLAGYGDRVRWVDQLPPVLQAVVVGNEVLDAMPVKLLARLDGVWHERGVGLAGGGPADEPPVFAWTDRPTALRPPIEPVGEHDYLTEIHLQAEAWIHTLGLHLQRGAAFLIDYGFPEREYFHPQRAMGTLMCHQGHRADADPLSQVGDKDITAHVNFTGIAVAAQDAGFDVLGYANQARFLLNCGLLQALEQASQPQRIMAQRLVLEHEMGELFKVIGLCKGVEPWAALGFAQGDRSHTL